MQKSSPLALILLVGVIAFTLLYVWLMLHRTRSMAMEDVLDDRGLEDAIVARRAEAGVAGSVAAHGGGSR